VSFSGDEAPASKGAQPLGGAQNEAEAAEKVRAMFDSIAPKYDLLNHLLSANVDRLWWRRTARTFQPVLARPDSAILDICCGTGDLTTSLLKLRPAGARPVLAADFARAMLRRGAGKFAVPASISTANRTAAASPHAVALEADALHLPLRDNSLDLIVTAFGFRNLANYDAGLLEFHRALKPGGRLGILEFSEPEGLLGALYAVYFRRVLPALGRLICGRNGPYNYLPTSVGNFPRPGEMLTIIQSLGFTECVWQPYTFGIAGLYTAMKPL
jgi:demethylmenaquinone methyltransferase/2-methoxy-6-polyprenyl-1,4-benzoquinol methylase